MTKAEFNKKYSAEIGKIAAANNVDLSVGSDMFVSNIKHAFNVAYNAGGKFVIAENYKGLSNNYKYHAAAQDYIEVLKG